MTLICVSKQSGRRLYNRRFTRNCGRSTVLNCRQIATVRWQLEHERELGRSRATDFIREFRDTIAFAGLNDPDKVELPEQLDRLDARATKETGSMVTKVAVPGVRHRAP